MPGRNYTSSDGYRYKFNGKESDDEIEGIGNMYDYGARMYDPRIGRFLSIDPLTRTFPMLTPYQYASNNPITNIDLDGLEGVNANTVLNSPVGNAPVTSPFNATRTCTNCSAIHRGVDYGVSSGSTVQATAGGTVVRANYSSSYGNVVIIRHGTTAEGKTIYTLYAHNTSFNVTNGQEVNSGDIISLSGNTGNSTGPHLHYEVIVTDADFGTNDFYSSANKVDPAELPTLINGVAPLTAAEKLERLNKKLEKFSKKLQRLNKTLPKKLENINKKLENANKKLQEFNEKNNGQAKTTTETKTTNQ